MEVCEVCGAFLIVGDAQSRVDDHLQRKQHVGYAKIKSTLDDLKVFIHFVLMQLILQRKFANIFTFFEHHSKISF